MAFSVIAWYLIYWAVDDGSVYEFFRDFDRFLQEITGFLDLGRGE